jgi:hypothetical protein
LSGSLAVWRGYREQLRQRFRQQEIVMRASSIELI